MGGVVGIGLAILVAGGLALITVAGAHGQLLTGLADGTVTWGPLTDYTYSGALPLASPGLGKIMLLLFAILGIVLLTNGHGISEVLWNITTGLLFAIIFACLATAIPAQIAAFIAHNFGTQRRIRDDLAKPPG